MSGLSVCITTYNRAGPLRECLESVLVAARGHDIELVVSDNASTDDTPRVLEEFAARVPWMRWHRLPTNIGGDRNFYRVTQAATREYAWILGDDDTLAPDAIGQLLTALVDGPTLAILNYETWDRDLTHPVTRPRLPLDAPTRIRSAEELMRRFGLGPSFISAVVFRRELFLTLPFEEYEELVAGGMAFFFSTYRMMRLAPDARFIPDVLVHQRGDNVPTLTDMVTWYRYFVQGVDEALTKLGELGYPAAVRERTRDAVLMDLVLPDIWNRVRTGQPIRRLFPLLRRCYARSIRFWTLCVPALFAPKWLLRLGRGGFRLVRGGAR